MMKKKTVRLISCIIAGFLVAAMVFSMIASGLVYAGAVSSKELKSKLSDLEDQKTSVKAELDSLAGKVDEVAKTRAALQKEILVVVRYVHEAAEVLLGSLDDGIVIGRSMTHLHH